MNSRRVGGSGGVGAFGAISLFFLRRRGRSCVWLAGTVVYNADEPVSWPDSDYVTVFIGFLTSTQTAGMGNLHVGTCSRTSRVTALRMGGFDVARWREKNCCVIPKRVAGVGFATFMEHTFPLRVFENHCFLKVFASPSLIGPKIAPIVSLRCLFAIATSPMPRRVPDAERATSEIA